MRLRVECYAGYKSDERPVAFHLGDQRLEVREVLDRWYGPSETYFRLRASDGHLYILRHRSHEPESEWTLESFRRKAFPDPTARCVSNRKTV